AIFGSAITFAGKAYDGPFPSEIDEQGYYVDYNLIGVAAFLGALIYLVVTVIRLRRNPDPRPQAIWRAGAVMIVGVLLVFIRPLSNSVDEPLSSILTFP